MPQPRVPCSLVLKMSPTRRLFSLCFRLLAFRLVSCDMCDDSASRSNTSQLQASFIRRWHFAQPLSINLIEACSIYIYIMCRCSENRTGSAECQVTRAGWHQPCAQFGRYEHITVEDPRWHSSDDSSLCSTHAPTLSVTLFASNRAER